MSEEALEAQGRQIMGAIALEMIRQKNAREPDFVDNVPLDNSEKYLRMCDCPEIQEQAPERVRIPPFATLPPFTCNCGKWVGERYHEVICDKCGANVGRAVWRPYQAHLQEMVSEHWMQAIGILWRYLIEDAEWAIQRAESWEQAWLIVVMREKHNKRWSDGEWIRS